MAPGIASLGGGLLLAAAAGCNLTEPVGDAGRDADVDADLGADVDAELDVDADADTPVSWTPGPLTLVVSSLEIIEERICDLDGDGDLDNAIADLGSPGSEILAGTMNAGIDASLHSGFTRVLLHFPRLEVSPAVMDGDATMIPFRGRDTDRPRDWTDDHSGDEPFYARAQSLDPCGEPAVSRDLHVAGGRVVASDVPLGFGIGEAGLELRGRLEGRFAPDGRSLDAEMCGATLIAELGGWTSTEEMTVLELFLAGGVAVGAPAVPGLSPDVDRDGDGLERFVLDEELHVASCIDGDGHTVIEGRDCWQDPRMADAFSLSLEMATTSAAFAGREPGWQLGVPGRCEAGMPEHSLFGDIVHDVACAGPAEPCDPLAPVPCCDADRVCQGALEGTYLCSKTCTPRPCDSGGAPGLCVPRHDEPPELCHPADNDVPESACTLDEPCTTEHGVETGTCAAIYASNRVVCLEGCAPPVDGCGGDLGVCFPLLVEDGGYCDAPR